MSTRASTLGLLALVLTAGAGGCASQLASPPTSAPTPTTAPTSLAAPSSVPPQPPVVVRACVGSDLAFVGVVQDAGMGSAFTAFTVRNRTPESCRLEGSPQLRHRRADGTTASVPVTPGGGGDRVILAPRQAAKFGVRTVNGYGGYDPGAPECAHPATYAHLAVVLDDGSTLPLGDNGSLSVLCGVITVNVWAAA